MKAMINLHQTVINNWRIGELANIQRCKGFEPVLKGYFWYECPTCGLRTRFNIPENLENPPEQIGNEIILSKKVPTKIYCPHCMLNYKGKVRRGIGSLAVQDISTEVGCLEQIPGLNKFTDNMHPTNDDNFFFASYKDKQGVPIYRHFEDMLRNGG